MKQINFRRNGDVNLHEITEEEFNNISGEIIKHDGSFVLARGEATGSEHRITVERPETMIIKKDKEGRMYFALNNMGTITHTYDHETLTTPKKVFYVQVPEREIDHFANGVIRHIVD